MIWVYNEEGYLMSVDLPKNGRCRSCGAEYIRAVSDARPWQDAEPDKCPECGADNGSIAGVSFQNLRTMAGSAAS